MRQTFLYLVFDSNDTPIYVGKTVAPKERFYCHSLRWPGSRCLIIEAVSEGEDWQARECFWIAYYRQWFVLENRSRGGRGPRLANLSEEHKRKIGQSNSLRLKGRKRLRASVEKARQTNTGKQRTGNALLNLQRSNRDPQKIERARRSATGNKRTAEFCSRTSARMAGNQYFLGRHHTPETKQKQSIARTAYWARRRGEI